LWLDLKPHEVTLTDDEKEELRRTTKWTVYDEDRDRYHIVIAILIVSIVTLIVVCLLTATPKAVVVFDRPELYVDYEEPDASLPPLRVPQGHIIRNTLDLPNVSGAKKTYMDFRTITRSGSAQLVLQQRAWTDEEGFRRVGDFYMVAMGTFYAQDIGQTYIVAFADGTQIKVIVGDVKDDRHTDSNNQYHSVDGSIVEFIIDKKIMSEKVIQTGDCSWVIGHGAVVEIRRCE
jgi:hypothetical protein